MLSGLLSTLVLTTLAGAQPPENFRISVNVDLVVLNVTVRDRSGRFVANLHEQDFDVRENGVRQSIRLFRHEDIPVTVGLVVDHSGSMRNKLPEVIAAIRAFVQSSSPEDEMFVVNFNEKVTLGLPGTVGLSNRPDQLALAILKTPAAGMTALYDAVIQAQERLKSGGRDKRVLVVISDGGDNASAHKLPEVLNMAEQSSTVIYTIGVFDPTDPDRNPGVLKRLADETGGEAFFPRELDDVVAICEKIARDIRSQYTVGYVPGGAAPAGRYRRVRVTARAAGNEKLDARTRAGYLAAGAR